MSNQLNDIMKEENLIAEGRGPLETPEQRASDLHNDKGWDLHCQNRFSEAIEEFNTAIRLNPRHALAINNKGLALRRLGLLQEAVKAFDDAMHVAPRFVKPYSNKAETLEMMGLPEQAVEWFRKALQVEPGYPRAVQSLEQLCARSPSSEDEKRSESLLHQHPEATMLIAQASAYMRIAHFQKALNLVEKALQLAPDVSEFLHAKADCLINLHRPEEGLQSAKRATELDPHNAAAYVSLAWAHLQIGEYEDALSCSERAVNLDDKNDMAWNNAGTALLLLGRYKEAAEKLNRALSINPNNYRAKMTQEAYIRKTERPDYVYIGWETLDVAECQLREGQCVGISFDFCDTNVPWDKIISLSNKHPRLIVIDSLDRSEKDIRKHAARLQKLGALGLSMDMVIRAAEKARAARQDA